MKASVIVFPFHCAGLFMQLLTTLWQPLALSVCGHADCLKMVYLSTPTAFYCYGEGTASAGVLYCSIYSSLLISSRLSLSINTVIIFLPVSLYGVILFASLILSRTSFSGPTSICACCLSHWYLSRLSNPL